jgi:AcrR family transcriptional regulator
VDGLPDDDSPSAHATAAHDVVEAPVEAVASAGPTRGRGRPRDPRLESRALRAALEIFSEKGWTGLTLDEVATRAKVGKSSLYLRWPDRQALLAAALRGVQLDQEDSGTEAGDDVDDAAQDRPAGDASADAPPADADPSIEPEPTPSLRDYLVAHARRRADLYLGENGLAMLRLYAEARANPEIFSEIREEAITKFVHDERRRVQEAVESGDLPATASPVRILDAVEGAIFMHILVTPPSLVARVQAGLDQYIEAMVDDQLRAAGFSPRGS